MIKTLATAALVVTGGAGNATVTSLPFFNQSTLLKNNTPQEHTLRVLEHTPYDMKTKKSDTRYFDLNSPNDPYHERDFTNHILKPFFKGLSAVTLATAIVYLGLKLKDNLHLTVDKPITAPFPNDYSPL